jgi:anaerobic magnesium-protoporphyrin IX monomethyl ester cyclase
MDIANHSMYTRERSVWRPRVCLIHSPCSPLSDDRLEAPLGLLYLASVLRDYGSPVTVCDLSGVPEYELTSKLEDGFDVYGFSTYSVSYRTTRRLLAHVQGHNPESLTIAGGPHASALPDTVLSDGFDVVVMGEGEQVIVDLMKELVAGKHPSGVYRATPVEDLDSLPFPAYDLLDIKSYSRRVEGHPSLSVLTSRGCPHRCSFCNSNIMGAGNRLRFRSPENVVRELRWLRNRFGIRHIRFQDDLFTADKSRLIKLTDALCTEDIIYRCFSRVTGFSRSVAEMLARSGCRHVSFGVESGSASILARHAMNKGQSPDQIRAALTHAHSAGLKSRIFLIVGFPGETDTTINETLELVKGCPWDEFSVYPLIAYPGTPLHDEPERFGITYIDRDYSGYLQIGSNYQAGFTIRTRDFDEHKVREWRDKVIDELKMNGRGWAGESTAFN